MNRPYGPWATPISAGSNQQLGAFWRRRIGMLVSVSETSPALSRRQMLILTGMAAATAALPTIRVATAEAEPPKDPADALQKIRFAWEKRRASLKSFWYECDFKQTGFQQAPTNAGRTAEQGDPFGPSGDNKLDPRGTFTLGCAGEKVAWVRQYDERNALTGKRQTTKNSASFDMVHYQMLGQTSGLPALGQIVSAVKLDKQDVFRAGVPLALRDMVRKYVNQTALWMWFSPVVHLKDVGYPVDKMEVRRLHARHNGRDCLEAAITAVVPDWFLAHVDSARKAAFRDEVAKWRMVLYVDPARDYLPIAYVHQHRGVTKRDVEILYVREHDDTWRVSAWEDKNFDESGKLYQTSNFEVKRCSINKPLHDDIFTWDFPKGAEIVDHDSDPPKYFLALGKGKRRYIPESEYGALHDKPPAP
jgi:hypothetical protein